ncbi:MAG TPA: IS200/IS605 family transposase [Ignavibacteria bacterium]
MSHSHTKIWIHLIFGTKERTPLIDEKFEKLLYIRINDKLKTEYNSLVYAINGTKDHIHILFLQDSNFSLSDIVKNIKGESSHWINQNNFIDKKFAWQSGYGAFSISDTKEDKIIEYIKNQKEHHKKISFAEEYNLFLKKYGFNSLLENR